ncbi:DUF6292 family protein [Actinophytocola sp.]|uniref:DUF6292 family protein n=1 Tax=Actinophytocola sp. TaxID=1872138 RepID=UPI003899F231
MTTTHHTNGHTVPGENGGPAHADSPHRGYILAVTEALSLRGLSVTVALVGGVAVWHADLELATVDRQTAVLLRWDELSGWSCQTRGAQSTPAISFGVSAVPLPTQVAVWVESVLAHPEFRPRRAQGLFLTPDLTARLGRYQTTA